MADSFWKGLKITGPLFWLLTAVLMSLNYSADPYSPSLEGASRYGHNHDGALTAGLSLTLVELFVVYAILRPSSYQRSWIRSVVALVVFVPWTACSVLMTMHAGGVIGLHCLWVVPLVLLLAVCAAWSGMSASILSREKPKRL